jgi:hypothetical protein
MGKPSLSVPPVILREYPGKPMISPLNSSPIFLPIKAIALV